MDWILVATSGRGQVGTGLGQVGFPQPKFRLSPLQGQLRINVDQVGHWLARLDRLAFDHKEPLQYPLR